VHHGGICVAGRALRLLTARVGPSARPQMPRRGKVDPLGVPSILVGGCRVSFEQLLPFGSNRRVFSSELLGRMLQSDDLAALRIERARVTRVA